MNAPSFSKTGTTLSSSQTINKTIFGLNVTDHNLLKQAYHAYLSNGRANLAVTKTRGLVRGGGRKPWRQKGTGKARFGSIRNPIWRGGGIVFGPTGQENYSIKLSKNNKRLALKQALSVKLSCIKIIEDFSSKEGKVAPSVKLLDKLNANRNVLLVVDNKSDLVERSTRNIPYLKLVNAKYLNVFDLLNADNIIITKPALAIIEEWLGGKEK